MGDSLALVAGPARFACNARCSISDTTRVAELPMAGRQDRVWAPVGVSAIGPPPCRLPHACFGTAPYGETGMHRVLGAGVFMVHPLCQCAAALSQGAAKLRRPRR